MRPTAPILYAMDLIGQKWKLPILWYIADDENQTLRYRELERKVIGITATILTKCLSIKVITVILICFLLAGCSLLPAQDESSQGGTEQTSSSQITSYSRDIFAMDTYMTVTCYGERAYEAAEAAEKEIKRLDSLLSVGKEDSEISNLNRSGSEKISSDTEIMVNKSLELYKETGGAFDITIYPVMELWGFTTHDYQVPDEQTLKETLELVGSDKVVLENGTLTLDEGRKIDLGGIAKGYTSDRLNEIFAEYELTSGMISLGGNVQLFGTKPDGSLWRCAVRDPNYPDSSEIMGVLEAHDCAVITSGAYERYFEDEDGNLYHHIIDPSTGYPADNGIISSTIVSSSGMLADGLSTAVYIMGLEKAAEFWRLGKEDFDMILMTDSKEIYVTEGIADSFKTDYPVHVLTR